MINVTPIESQPGDFICHACTNPGETVKSSAAIWACSRGCGRRTSRRLVEGVAKVDEAAKATPLHVPYARG